jgi:phospholipase/carboxylesterase
VRIERVVRVACPARGTLLASKRLDAYVSVLKWSLELAGIPVAPLLVDFIGEVASQRTDPGLLPGLEAMTPESPLVQWLHGSEGDEQQIRHIMPQLSMRNYVAIAPRGTCEIRTDEICVGRHTYAWRQSADAIDEAESRVLDCIAISGRRFNIHEKRVFLAGVGCGGTMALRTAWNHPDRFAGVATFGGPLPVQNRPLRNVNALRALPCFVATGRTSQQYPEPEVCRDLRLLHTAGCTVALRQYPCGDDLTTTMLGDLNRWMMDIVCPQGK